MHKRLLCFAVIAVNCFGQVSAQGGPRKNPDAHTVSPARQYHRLICLVHFTGSGQTNDPRRPEYTPGPQGDSRDGILAWASQPTDDGQMVIVHLVAANRKAFESILADRRSEIRVFEIGKNTQLEIETEMRKYRGDFELNSFEVAVQ